MGMCHNHLLGVGLQILYCSPYITVFFLITFLQPSPVASELTFASLSGQLYNHCTKRWQTCNYFCIVFIASVCICCLYNLLALLLPVWKDASKPSAKDLVSRSISVPARLPTEQVGVGSNPSHWMPWLPSFCLDMFLVFSEWECHFPSFGMMVLVDLLEKDRTFNLWLFPGFVLFHSSFSCLTPPPPPSSRRCFLFFLKWFL